jgi:hypothetical protein
MSELLRSISPHPVSRQVVVLTTLHGSRLARAAAHRPYRSRDDATVDGCRLALSVSVSRKTLREDFWTYEFISAALRESGVRMGHCALEHARTGKGVQAVVLAQGQWDRMTLRCRHMDTASSRTSLLPMRWTIVKTTSILSCQMPALW